VLKENIMKLLEMGHIRPSNNPYESPVLFVQKKNGSLHMCIDYRGLNKITIRDQFPLPRIEELLDQLAGARYFTALNLDFTYHQVRLKEANIPKSAFTCSEGHFEFMMMTLGSPMPQQHSKAS
jgi:hypothetical protein